MEKIGSLPTPTLTDREILLLTYQQLQNVTDEFRAYKTSNDSILHDLQTRMGQMEQHMSTAEALKSSDEARLKKQVTLIGIVFTAINVAISAITSFSHKL